MTTIAKLNYLGQPHAYQDDEYVHWDGRSILLVHRDVIDDYIKPLCELRVGDTFQLWGYTLLIVDAHVYGYFKCMVESIAAHRLLMFNIVYDAELRIWVRLVRAKLVYPLLPL